MAFTSHPFAPPGFQVLVTGDDAGGADRMVAIGSGEVWEGSGSSIRGGGAIAALLLL